MRSLCAVSLIALAALFAATPADGKKPVRCKAGQVRVKVGKKKARCRSVKAVLPKPRPVDPRMAFVKTALNLPVPKGHRHGQRRTKALRRGFGRPGRKAYKRILKALPKALAKVDAKAPGRAPLAHAAQAADPCGGDGVPVGSSTTSDGGVILTTDFTTGGMGMTIVFSTAGYSFVIEYFSSQGCNDFDIPACPTASGAADADADRLDRIRVDIRKDGKLVSSQRSSVRRKTKTHGQTAADALLDFVDVDDVVSMDTVANGVTVKGKLKRHTHIDMRTNRYDPSQSSASFEGAQALQKSDNDSFAGLAGGIIAVYHSAETNPGRIGFGAGWAVFDRPDGGNFCIHAVYSPDIGTLKLRRGASGTFSANAIASDGGVAADGRWTPTRQNNGSFSPSPASGGAPTIGYHVASDANPDELLLVSYKITSTGGVVESTWSQDVEDARPILHIRGSLSGSQAQATGAGPSVITVTSNLAFDRSGADFGGPANGQYQSPAGSYTLVASGIDGSGITACHQTGSHTFTVPKGESWMRVDGSGPSFAAPYTYTFQVFSVPRAMTATRVGCPESAKDYEGTTFQTGLYSPFQPVRAQRSADGKSYVGSEDQTSGGSGIKFSWSLQGTE
jgi:hypothetical protein